MLPGERLKGWIEGLAASWKDRLRGWMASWLMGGINDFLGSNEAEAIDMARDTLSKVRDDPNTPPEIKALIDKLTAGTQPIPVVIVVVLAAFMIIPSITAMAQPLGRLLEYAQDKLLRTARLDPLSVITAWRRDPLTYNKFFDDLRELGWTDERIEALKYLTEVRPSPQEAISLMAHEAFEEGMVEKYGLDDEFGNLDFDYLATIGITKETAKLHWRGHWQHASWIQVVEMLRRGQMTEADVWEWFRVVEIPPFWRQKLINISWAVPTRVDVRRFWDMRTIDEARLREVYGWQGYHGKDLDDYVLWTKVYVAYPDLLARWTKGWITIDDVRSELVALGMPAARVEEMIQTKIKPEEPARVSAERDVTKTDIYKGVKQGVITRTEAMELLIELGFSEDEADYLLAINISPDEEAPVVAARQLTKTDIIAGLKALVITDAEARAKLLELRYSGIDADFLLDIFKATITPPAEARDREASKADIVKAVKMGLILPEEAYLMLQDIGFTPEASQFILMVQAEASPFSPRSFAEFKDINQKWRRAAGREVKAMPEELKAAAAEVVRLTDEVASLKRSITGEKRGLVGEEILPAPATERLTELEVALHRAEAELARVKSEYESRVAEWRQRGE